MKKIIIIGGGIAGLSAGIYAQNNQFESVICEKNKILGGECTGWWRGDYYIDNCIHVLTGTKKSSPLHTVWEKVGALDDTIPVIQSEYLYASKKADQKVSFYRDIEHTRQEMLDLSPADAEEINCFIQAVKDMACLEIPSKMPVDFMHPMEAVKLVKSMKTAAKMIKKYKKINLFEYAKKFSHPLLQAAMCDYLPGEYSVYSLLAMYAFFTSGNGGIPEGGSSAMADRMKQKYLSLDGNIKENMEVKEILIKEGKTIGVRLKSGEEVMADYVVAACDLYELYFHLLNKTYQDQKIIDLYRDHHTNWVTSGVIVALSVDGLMEDADGTIHYDCDEFNVATKKVNRIQTHNYNYQRSFAPEGKTVMECHVFQFPGDYLYWRKLYKNKSEYEKTKSEIAEQIVRRIENEYPEYKGKLSVLDVWTPMSFEKQCKAYAGSYMSFPPTKESHNIMLSGKANLASNLYMASQWQMSGGGLPVAVTMGKFAIQRIMKQERIKRKLWKEI